MSIKKQYIPAPLKSAAKDGFVTDASEILDETKNKRQNVINQETDNEISGIKGGSAKSIAQIDAEINGNGGIDERLGTVEQLAEISIGGGDAQIATGEDFTNPDATKRAKVPTVGAVLDGMNDGVYDVSKRNPTGGENSDGKFTLEYILENADTLIPTSWRHGGMEICFVQSSDNKYVQYRLMSTSFSTSDSDWQGVVKKPMPNSFSLVTSDGVAFEHAIQNIIVADCAVQTDTWVKRSDLSHIMIPVNGGERISWTGNSTLYYVLLTEYNGFPQGGETPSFLTGYPNRQQSTSPIIIPDGCKFFVVNNPSNYTDIKINNISVVGGLWKYVLQKIDQYGIADGAITLAKLANDVVGAGIEHVNYKKTSIERSNTNDDYIGARSIYEALWNINSGLSSNKMLNLFSVYKRVTMSSTGSAGAESFEDTPSSSYQASNYIEVEQGHTYYFSLKGSSSITLIREFSSSKEFISNKLIGNNTIQNGYYTPTSNVAFVILCSNGDVGSFIDVTDNLYAFKDDILVSSLTTDVVSNNIANPADVWSNTEINSNGYVRTYTQWTVNAKVEWVKVVPGTTITFGGNDLVAAASTCAFYSIKPEQSVSGDITYMVGSPISVARQDMIDGKTLTVPSGAYWLVYVIQASGNPSTDNIIVQVNKGDELIEYDEYREGIVKINGMPIGSSELPANLEDRVETIEGNIATIQEDISDLQDDVAALNNEGLIVDLPVDDGTGIGQGYAYIDSTTGIVKVKLS